MNTSPLSGLTHTPHKHTLNMAATPGNISKRVLNSTRETDTTTDLCYNTAIYICKGTSIYDIYIYIYIHWQYTVLWSHSHLNRSMWPSHRTTYTHIGTYKAPLWARMTIYDRWQPNNKVVTWSSKVSRDLGGMPMGEEVFILYLQMLYLLNLYYLDSYQDEPILIAWKLNNISSLKDE